MTHQRATQADQKRERAVIILEDLEPGCPAPFGRRLARFLKLALRTFGLKCTSVGPAEHVECDARERLKEGVHRLPEPLNRDA